MTTTTNCPHCGASVSSYGPEMYDCGTFPASAHPLGCYDGKDNTLVLSGLCIERAAHAETEKERLDLSIKLLAANLNESKLAKELSETRRKLEEAEKALDYYKSAFMRQKPRWIPARVRVFKEVRADYPVADAYEPIHAGEVECRSNRLGAVSVVNMNGVEIGLRPSEFDVVAWREAEKGGAS